MSKPIVSIIITCFNQENYIVSSLKSVKNQTFENWECIIIDDGSTDKSANLIKDFISGDVRFKYVYQENKGVSLARNLGFEFSKGDFIQILDGDDTLLPNKLMEQLKCFDEDPGLYVCICDHQHYFESKNLLEHYKFESIEEFPLEQLIYKWQNGVAFPPHAALYRRLLWQVDEEFFPSDYKKRSEDWVFNILVALKGKKYKFLDKILCNYHMTRDSYTSDLFNSASSAIHAAFYIKPLLPIQYQNNFIDFTIKKSMDRYLNSKRGEILRESGNWKLGNLLTFPFFRIKKFFKAKDK